MTRRKLVAEPTKSNPMTKINIQFTLFSAFYSPLISTMSGGFLKAEGLDADWSISPPGVSAIKALEDGSAHVIQSALSQGFGPVSKGETPAALHFAQVNEMVGFFITAREPDPGLYLGQAGGRGRGAARRRPTAGDVQIRLPQGRHRLHPRSMPLTLAALPKSTRRSATARAGMFSNRARFHSNWKPTRHRPCRGPGRPDDRP